MNAQASLEFFAPIEQSRRTDEVLKDVRALVQMHQNGLLGGLVMPEDAHPRLPAESRELSHYFTLGMALNYQRNSYSLWQSATAAFLDSETNVIFDPTAVAKLSRDRLSGLLLKHRVGLQPTKHTATWHVICCSICELYAGDIRNLFLAFKGDIGEILESVQGRHKKYFPYLSGRKIANYWLYVMASYTRNGLKNRTALNVAPDTHVIQSSCRLGLITAQEEKNPKAPLIVAERWRELLRGTEISPIDVHTPLWLWSKSGFKTIVRPN